MITTLKSTSDNFHNMVENYVYGRLVYVGVDPGGSGAIAILKVDGTGLAIDMPETEGDIAFVLKMLADSDCQSKLLIERVHAMPKQGVASTFTFGRNYGFLRGCIQSSSICWGEVTPQRWQSALGCLSKGDKNVTKNRAQQIFPNLAPKSRITHANADALLIAYYLLHSPERTDSAAKAA